MKCKITSNVVKEKAKIEFFSKKNHWIKDYFSHYYSSLFEKIITFEFYLKKISSHVKIRRYYRHPLPESMVHKHMLTYSAAASYDIASLMCR